MNWDLIPEVFFDLIARVVPGSLFLLGVATVHFGPRGFVRVLAESLPSANAASLLLVLLLAYFAAIVLKVIWEFSTWVLRELAASIVPDSKAPGNPTRTDTKDGRNRTPSDPLLRIQKTSPSGASRLLKLQAEKNMCEVLVPGLTILLFSNARIIQMGASEDSAERVALEVVLLTSGLACWWWRSVLEAIYLRDMKALDGSDEGKLPDGSGVRTS